MVNTWYDKTTCSRGWLAIVRDFNLFWATERNCKNETKKIQMFYENLCWRPKKTWIKNQQKDKVFLKLASKLGSCGRLANDVIWFPAR